MKRFLRSFGRWARAGHAAFVLIRMFDERWITKSVICSDWFLFNVFFFFPFRYLRSVDSYACMRVCACVCLCVCGCIITTAGFSRAAIESTVWEGGKRKEERYTRNGEREGILRVAIFCERNSQFILRGNYIRRHPHERVPRTRCEHVPKARFARFRSVIMEMCNFLI